MSRRSVVFLLLVAVVFAFWLFSGGEETPPQANAETLRETTRGPVVGFSDDYDTHAWLGIPYAASTAGEQRWRAPQPATPWTETRESLNFGPSCPQPWNRMAGVSGSAGTVAGSEDCLSLNIWSPRVGADQVSDQKRPVLVWIHGGGNTVGASSMYPASHLAGSQEMLVVSINYRLGLLGWFSHPALRGDARSVEEASGNFALLDMVAALDWVQDNIAAFGGDPGNVTVSGESAGGRNVYLLVASPLARGLFHRAIVQSGSTATQSLSMAENLVDAVEPGVPNSSGETVVRLLQVTGKASDREAAISRAAALDDAELVEFLRGRSLDEIFSGITASGLSYRAPQAFRDGTVLPQDALLDVFRDPARYSNVPIITGSNRDENKLFLALNPEYSDAWFGLIPRIADQQEFDRMSAYLSDRWKLKAVDTPAEIISTHGGPPVFAYRWDWDEGGDIWLVDWSTALGAAHGLEIPFMLGDFERIIPIPGLFNDGNREERERLSQQMMNYWGEFARSGQPGTGGVSDQPEWHSWKAGSGALMVLDTEADGGPRLVSERMTPKDLADRISVDPALPDQESRCAFFDELFASERRGRELDVDAEARSLGCSN
jgi:para-nitrobenzyl esterase